MRISGVDRHSWAAASTREPWRAAFHAETLGFPWYLPQIREWHGFKERRQFLFPGFILLHIGARDWVPLAAQMPRDLIRLIMSPVDEENRRPARIADKEIAWMIEAEDEEGFVSLLPGLAAGDRVIVREGTGPYGGVRGIVRGTPAPGRVDVLMLLLGKQFKKQFAESQLVLAAA